VVFANKSEEGAKKHTTDSSIVESFEKDYGQEALSYFSMPICTSGTHKNNKSLFHHYYEV
jgi:hypothetical protein